MNENLLVNPEIKNVLMALLTSNSSDNQKKYTEEEKIKAAYALNMCTVSVSQIIDYSDLNVLEQEYDAILNNLNLEQIPKDEALLHILKQLLDTITYFRIEAGEKEMIEKEYQQKMKNAIWSAVPNFGLIVAGGNPITMAISLASQVGIGYMNYRRNKAEYSLDYERKNWELQKTAIEQLNGLRRELFDTAWRLADTYGFPDDYRLTEKQITQYNKILMDQDEIRKYERLESIKDDFQAYPPFWYFIGNAANYIACSENLNLSDTTKDKYRDIALAYFEKFETLNKYNVLRQDQMTAACALEHIDVLLFKETGNSKKIQELLDTAVKYSKNAFDVQELCALAYLKIGEQDKASSILRVLVNEDYNKIINAQLLSSIYVYQMKRSDYELLATRVDTDYLYPMPQNGESLEELEAEFGAKQKNVLKLKYKVALNEYIDKYAIEWNKVTSVFDPAADYPNDFFLETSKAKNERLTCATRLYNDGIKKEYYQQRMAESGYEIQLLSVLNEMCTNMFRSPSFSSVALEEKAENSIKQNLLENKDDINKLQEAMLDRKFNRAAYVLSQSITLPEMVGKAMGFVMDYVIEQVDAANINEITYLESNLRTFCNNNGITPPEIAINRGSNTDEMFNKDNDLFGPQIFGATAIAAKKNAEFMAEMTKFIKEKMNAIDPKNADTAIYFSDSSEFNGYFMNVLLAAHSDIRSHAMMILKDCTRRKFDLIFTTDGIVSVIKDKVKNLTPYNEIKRKDDSILLYRNELILTREYKVLSFDINTLYSLICQLGSRFVKDVNDKIEYIDGIVTPQLLNSWFKENPEAMEEDSIKVYALVTPEILQNLGYHFGEELDPERSLLQYYRRNAGDEILGLRIIRFDKIDSNFQAMLMDKNGMIKVK